MEFLQCSSYTKRLVLSYLSSVLYMLKGQCSMRSDQNHTFKVYVNLLCRMLIGQII